MKFDLIRAYGPRGTTGRLLLNGALVCHTLEHPRNNPEGLSCLPEGEYMLQVTAQPGDIDAILINGIFDKTIAYMVVADGQHQLEGSDIGITGSIVNPIRGVGSMTAIVSLFAVLKTFARPGEIVVVSIKSDLA